MKHYNHNEPMLLDRLTKSEFDTKCEIDGGWFIAKPLMSYYGIGFTFFTRLRHAWLVLRNKAHTWQYAEDYKGSLPQKELK